MFLKLEHGNGNKNKFPNSRIWNGNEKKYSQRYGLVMGMENNVPNPSWERTDFNSLGKKLGTGIPEFLVQNFFF